MGEVMLFNVTFRVSCLQLLCLFLALFFTQTAVATVNWHGQWYAPGSTANITINPAVPTKGEPFTVNISGEWGNRCIPDPNRLTLWAENNGSQQSVRMHTYVSEIDECGEEFEPTAYSLSCTLPNWVWEVLDGNQYWNINLNVEGYSNIYRNLIGVLWGEKIDLKYGLHTIPPKIGTGNWVSESTPYQGLNIAQQGNTLVAYEMKYNRVTGEPNWHYATGSFIGNSLNGVAYLINWLAPNDEARPDYNWLTGSKISDLLFQPKIEDLHFEPSAFGLTVNGVNKINAYVGLWRLSNVPYTYKRWVFDLSDTELPPVVPDMAGVWNLYGFDEQHLKQSHQIEFKTGTKVGGDLYQFSSADEEWVLSCQVKLDGEGDCTLSNENLGLTMTYNLISDVYLKSGYIDAHFNGNYAYARLVSLDGNEAEQTGILLRSGLRLPVFDLEENPADPTDPIVPPEAGGFWDRFSCSGS